MKIIYKHETGIAIVHPTGEVSIETLMITAVPEEYKLTAMIVEDDAIPEDRTFRDAWDFDGEKIFEDVNKAKEIHKNRLRQERKALLEATDVQFMKALETGEDTKQIVIEKQRLRDVTKLVDSCNTIEEIKQVTVNAESRDTIL